MRVCKSLFVLSLLTLALTATVSAQTNDSLWVVPANTSVLNQAGTFAVTVMMNNNTTTAQSITLPIAFGGGNANLNCDVSVTDGFGNTGITQKALGSNPAWTIRSSLVDNTAKTILIGYVSFGLGLAPSNDSLVKVHFALTAGGSDAVHNVDSTSLPPSNTLTITDPLANDVTPKWTKGTISIGAVSVGEGVTPLTYGLDQNYPNPFNAQTRIDFSLAKPGKVQLTVFNILGQQVNTLVDREMTADRHTIVWDGTSAQGEVVASGTYFYRLRIGDDFEETRQMTLLK